MSVSFSPGQVNVTGNVTASNAPVPPTGGALVYGVSNVAAAGTTDIYTVTAGKTLYITSLNVCGQAATAGTAYIQVDILGTGVYKTVLACNWITGGNSSSLTFPIAITCPATKKVQLVATGTVGSAYGIMVGYEI